MLDPKTKARIAQEAKSYAGTTLPNVPIGVPKTFVDEGKRKHYIAGAEAEATRAVGLVEALDRVKRQCLACGWREEVRDSVINDILKGVEKALTKYNNPVK